MRYSTLVSCNNCVFQRAAAGAGSTSATDSGVYPNPAQDQALLTLTTAEPDRVTVTVWNAAGRQVRTVRGAAATKAGQARVHIGLGGLPDGLYLYRATTAEGVHQGKIVKAD